MPANFPECCKSVTFNAMKEKFTNSLIKESSPYLLQHAYNPVDWHPWNDSMLENARNTNKLLLISIGYAACHWCHVMEKESFEDEDVANLMNSNFINIKVDREERPDIDHIYMNAVQLITGSGGWPLNVIALPDGRPVWGGTYFRKEQWMHVLQQLVKLYKTEPGKLLEYAAQLEKGLVSLNTVQPVQDTNAIGAEKLQKAVATWAAYFDHEYGGPRRAPKFMMPVNLQFLLHYGTKMQDTTILKYVETTLTKMAYGGVFDHVGGGFSRYATDERWHVPHFEKMLYDNAQLVSLYSNAWQVTKKPLYKEVVEKILFFVEKELTHKEGAFFSSLDADSINEKGIREEGAFYIWKKETLQHLLRSDFDLFAEYYNINTFGHWEHQNHVLIRNASEETIARKHKCSVEKVKTTIQRCNQRLFEARNKRSKPPLDDKTLTSWNALMLKAYADAYKAFGNEDYRNKAVKNARFIIYHQLKEDNGLYHSFKHGKSSINGFLEDYATVCDAFIALYEVSCDEKWLLQARQLVQYCFDYFYDEKSGLFCFTSVKDTVVVTRTVEKQDNVIPASNSIMAKILFKLSHYFQHTGYLETAEKMLQNLKSDILEYPYSHANWLDLALYFTTGFYEIAITGPDAVSRCKEITKYYLPSAIIAATEHETTLPFLKDRFTATQTRIYVCENNHCKLPVETVGEALQQLQ